MKKIETMTPEQEAKVPVYLKKWLDNGRSTKRIDRNKTIEAVKTIYKVSKLAEPKHFFFFPSPLQCQLAVSVLQKTELKDMVKNGDNLWANLGANLWANLGHNLGDNLWANLGANLRANLWANLGANLWAKIGDNLGAKIGDNLRTQYHGMFYGNIEWVMGWTGFYDFILNELFEERISEFKDFINYLEAMKHVHIFIPYKDVVFISDRPTELHVNEKGCLHADLKPAMMYEDGYALFYLNGVKMPKEIVATAGNKLKTLKVIGEKNVDVRREGLRKISIDKIVKDTKAKVLDKWKDKNKNWCDYILYDMNFKDGKIRRVLKMKNPSVPNTEHWERVDDGCVTVKQAICWRNGQDDYLKPKKEFYEREQLT